MTRRFGNRRGRRKARVVSPIMGQAGVQAGSQTVDSLREHGSELALAYMIRILLETAEEGRRSERRHAGAME